VSSVLNSDYPNFEVIFVDNGSTDDSVKFIKEKFCQNSRLKIVVNPENYGFSRGNNIAMQYTSGDYVALLNNDVEVESNWLRELIKVMEADSTIGIAQSKIISSDRVNIQTVGNVLDVTLSTYHIGRKQKDGGQYDKVCEITFACGAALIIRRSLIERIGLFDPNYFFYHDDCDLGWRARLSGFKILSVPSSIVYHKGWGTSTTTITENQRFFLLFVSRIGLLIKNPELKNFLKLGTLLGVSMSMDILGMLLKGDLKTPMRLILWTLKNFRHNWRCRIVVQNQIRKVTDDEVFKAFLDSSIFVLRIRRHFDKIVGGKLYRSFDELVNQATNIYYNSHIYCCFLSKLSNHT
jgi:GT2 family glycosyltransferase